MTNYGEDFSAGVERGNFHAVQFHPEKSGEAGATHFREFLKNMIEIIPAMDLIGGKCVRLTQGDFSRETVYSDDPLETAKRFEATGLKRLHMVDLDGARSGSPANLHVLKHVASGTSLNIDYGGGIKSEADIAAVLGAAGASMVNIGSLAARQPETFLGWVD